MRFDASVGMLDSGYQANHFFMSSMTPKILLAGSNGQVGFELQRSLASLGEVIAFDRSRCYLYQKLNAF
jgi:hypothetical protein